ncbi:MAG: family 78 glycoside hydrolase catalytic domain [Candidatus Izemoplasmatales bacterium]|jgi:alpha-L-rhamnosidase
MIKIASLKVEYQVNPIGLSEKNPRFSWTYELSPQLQQASYRIRVASANGLLETSPDLWDSGMCASNQMSAISYQGKPLISRQRCFVRLDVRNSQGETDFHTGTFEMGLLNETDFKGKWVSIPNNFQGSTLYFRKKLEIPTKGLLRARAYIAGIGYHEFYVNGQKVSDRVLNPGVTDYQKTVLYDTYDITDLFTETDNVVGIEVGYGWLGSRKMLAQFYFDYEEYQVLEDHSNCNSGWWVSGSPIRDNSIYGGETYDARREKLTHPHWASRDFEPAWDNGWMYTIVTQPPQGTLTSQQIEPIRICRSYPAIRTTEIEKDRIVYDIGQNIAGWAKITVEGCSGAKVVLKYGEGLTSQGQVNQLNLRSATATDTYILKGEGIETYQPRFTYHGFQYVQAELEGDVRILSLTGEHVHTDVEVAGGFTCSDKDLNQLHQNAVVTEQNNIHSIMTDCPQRDERFGWLNDLTTRIYQSIYNFHLERLLPKIVQDIAETKTKEGAISDTAPFYTGGTPADVTSISFLLFAEVAHQYYGDSLIANRFYPDMKDWVDYLLTRQKNYIMDYSHYGDWVAPEHLSEIKTDPIYVSTVFLNWHLQVLAKLAKLVGNDEDAKKYQAFQEASTQAINQTYYNKLTHQYSRGTQAENAFALNLGIAPKADRDKIAKNIADDIIHHGYHSTSGNQGYRHVFYSLTEAGYVDLLIKMIKNPEYPGWGYMLACNATTVWERWEKEMANVMHSFDHPMFGSYDAWFYRYLGGIQIGDGCAADQVTIQPVIPTDLTYVRCHFDSVRGRIESNWEKRSGTIQHEITIPGNTEATIRLSHAILSVNGEKVSTVIKDKRHQLRLSSGHYVILCKE